MKKTGINCWTVAMAVDDAIFLLSSSSIKFLSLILRVCKRVKKMETVALSIKSDPANGAYHARYATRHTPALGVWLPPFILLHFPSEDENALHTFVSLSFSGSFSLFRFGCLLFTSKTSPFSDALAHFCSTGVGNAWQRPHTTDLAPLLYL